MAICVYDITYIDINCQYIKIIHIFTCMSMYMNESTEQYFKNLYVYTFLYIANYIKIQSTNTNIYVCKLNIHIHVMEKSTYIQAV